MSQTQTGNHAATTAVSEAGTIVVRRIIPATVDELFDAWLDPDSLAQWMRADVGGPSSVTLDARVGGDYEVVMHHPDRDMRHYGTYRVIERNRKLVFTWFSGATHHTESLVTVDFNALDSGTEIVITHEQLPDHDAGMAHGRGWTALLERLQDHYSRRHAPAPTTSRT